MARERDYARLHAAAYHFARFSRKAAEIAKSVGVADKTVRQYAQDPEWDRALNVFGYTGIREFERSPRRDVASEKAEIYERAREIYIQLLKDGAPRHKLASLTAKAVDMPTRTIHRWATNANWLYVYCNMKLTKQIAKDIILEIYVRDSNKAVLVTLRDVMTAVSKYHRARGGILPEKDKDLESDVMLGLHDVRFSGYAKKAPNGDTNTMYEWIISPTKFR